MRVLIPALLVSLYSFGLAAEDLSPAQQKIEAAKKALESAPNNLEVLNRLAMAYTHRARETADGSFYDMALSTVERSLSRNENNFGAEKIRAWALLGKHEFVEALTLARDLNRRAPDDVLVYGLLTDAHVELGQYDDAERAAQWMLDLRPGNLAGLTRGAYLRELFGDIDGAIEWMHAAYVQTYFHEVEDRAWILTQIAHLEGSRGNIERAEEMATQALELFPGYHYGLKEMASIRRAQSRLGEAVELLERRYVDAPHPENLYDLARALESAGHIQEADDAFRAFEEQALAESENHDNANRELIFFYADHRPRPSKALAVAELTHSKRKDVVTLDAYAWALHRVGRSDQAWVQIRKALDPGIKRASFLYHAGVIANSLGKAEQARSYFEESLQLNPVSEVAEPTRRAQQALNEVGTSGE